MILTINVEQILNAGYLISREYSGAALVRCDDVEQEVRGEDRQGTGDSLVLSQPTIGGAVQSSNSC